MISNRPVRRLSLLAMLVITIVAALAIGSSAAQAMPVDGGTSTNPWVQSDELDYAPGSTVTLSGGNWQPGENVHIFVDDTNGHTWNHSADVTADDAGEIQDVFDLPNVVGRRLRRHRDGQFVRHGDRGVSPDVEGQHGRMSPIRISVTVSSPFGSELLSVMRTIDRKSERQQ